MTDQEKLEDCVRAMEHLEMLARNGRWDLVAQCLEAPNTGWRQAMDNATQERA